MEQEKLVFYPIKEVFHIPEVDFCTRDAAGVIVDGKVYIAKVHMSCLDQYLEEHPKESLVTVQHKKRAGFQIIGKNLICGSLPFFTNMTPREIVQVLHEKFPARPIYYYNSHKRTIARLYPRAAAVSAA